MQCFHKPGINVSILVAVLWPVLKKKRYKIRSCELEVVYPSCDCFLVYPFVRWVRGYVCA